MLESTRVKAYPAVCQSLKIAERVFQSACRRMRSSSKSRLAYTSCVELRSFLLRRFLTVSRLIRSRFGRMVRPTSDVGGVKGFRPT